MLTQTPNEQSKILSYISSFANDKVKITEDKLKASIEKIEQCLSQSLSQMNDEKLNLDEEKEKTILKPLKEEISNIIDFKNNTEETEKNKIIDNIIEKLYFHHLAITLQQQWKIENTKSQITATTQQQLEIENIKSQTLSDIESAMNEKVKIIKNITTIENSAKEIAPILNKMNNEEFNFDEKKTILETLAREIKKIIIFNGMTNDEENKTIDKISEVIYSRHLTNALKDQWKFEAESETTPGIPTTNNLKDHIHRIANNLINKFEIKTIKQLKVKLDELVKDINDTKNESIKDSKIKKQYGLPNLLMQTKAIIEGHNRAVPKNQTVENKIEPITQQEKDIKITEDKIETKPVVDSESKNIFRAAYKKFMDEKTIDKDSEFKKIDEEISKYKGNLNPPYQRIQIPSFIKQKHLTEWLKKALKDIDDAGSQESLKNKKLNKVVQLFNNPDFQDRLFFNIGAENYTYKSIDFNEKKENAFLKYLRESNSEILKSQLLNDEKLKPSVEERAPVYSKILTSIYQYFKEPPIGIQHWDTEQASEYINRIEQKQWQNMVECWDLKAKTVESPAGLEMQLNRISAYKEQLTSFYEYFKTPLPHWMQPNDLVKFICFHSSGSVDMFCQFPENINRLGNLDQLPSKIYNQLERWYPNQTMQERLAITDMIISNFNDKLIQKQNEISEGKSQLNVTITQLEMMKIKPIYEDLIDIDKKMAGEEKIIIPKWMVKRQLIKELCINPENTFKALKADSDLKERLLHNANDIKNPLHDQIYAQLSLLGCNRISLLDEEPKVKDKNTIYLVLDQKTQQMKAYYGELPQSTEISSKDSIYEISDYFKTNHTITAQDNNFHSVTSLCGYTSHLNTETNNIIKDINKTLELKKEKAIELRPDTIILEEIEAKTALAKTLDPELTVEMISSCAPTLEKICGFTTAEEKAKLNNILFQIVDDKIDTPEALRNKFIGLMKELEENEKEKSRFDFLGLGSTANKNNKDAILQKYNLQSHQPITNAIYQSYKKQQKAQIIIGKQYKKNVDKIVKLSLQSPKLKEHVTTKAAQKKLEVFKQTNTDLDTELNKYTAINKKITPPPLPPHITQNSLKQWLNTQEQQDNKDYKLFDNLCTNPEFIDRLLLNEGVPGKKSSDSLEIGKTILAEIIANENISVAAKQSIHNHIQKNYRSKPYQELTHQAAESLYKIWEDHQRIINNEVTEFKGAKIRNYEAKLMEEKDRGNFSLPSLFLKGKLTDDITEKMFAKKTNEVLRYIILNPEMGISSIKEGKKEYLLLEPNDLSDRLYHEMKNLGLPDDHEMKNLGLPDDHERIYRIITEINNQLFKKDIDKQNLLAGFLNKIEPDQLISILMKSAFPDKTKRQFDSHRATLAQTKQKESISQSSSNDFTLLLKTLNNHPELIEKLKLDKNNLGKILYTKKEWGYNDPTSILTRIEKINTIISQAEDKSIPKLELAHIVPNLKKEELIDLLCNHSELTINSLNEANIKSLADTPNSEVLSYEDLTKNIYNNLEKTGKPYQECLAKTESIITELFKKGELDNSQTQKFLNQFKQFKYDTTRENLIKQISKNEIDEEMQKELPNNIHYLADDPEEKPFTFNQFIQGIYNSKNIDKLKKTYELIDHLNKNIFTGEAHQQTRNQLLNEFNKLLNKDNIYQDLYSCIELHVKTSLETRTVEINEIIKELNSSNEQKIEEIEEPSALIQYLPNTHVVNLLTHDRENTINALKTLDINEIGIFKNKELIAETLFKNMSGLDANINAYHTEEILKALKNKRLTSSDSLKSIFTKKISTMPFIEMKNLKPEVYAILVDKEIKNGEITASDTYHDFAKQLFELLKKGKALSEKIQTINDTIKKLEKSFQITIPPITAKELIDVFIKKELTENGIQIYEDKMPTNEKIDTAYAIENINTLKENIKDELIKPMLQNQKVTQEAQEVIDKISTQVYDIILNDRLKKQFQGLINEVEDLTTLRQSIESKTDKDFINEFYKSMENPPENKENKLIIETRERYNAIKNNYTSAITLKNKDLSTILSSYQGNEEAPPYLRIELPPYITQKDLLAYMEKVLLKEGGPEESEIPDIRKLFNNPAFSERIFSGVDKDKGNQFLQKIFNINSQQSQFKLIKIALYRYFTDPNNPSWEDNIKTRTKSFETIKKEEWQKVTKQWQEKVKENLIEDKIKDTAFTSFFQYMSAPAEYKNLMDPALTAFTKKLPAENSHISDENLIQLLILHPDVAAGAFSKVPENIDRLGNLNTLPKQIYNQLKTWNPKLSQATLLKVTQYTIKTYNEKIEIYLKNQNDNLPQDKQLTQDQINKKKIPTDLSADLLKDKLEQKAVETPSKAETIPQTPSKNVDDQKSPEPSQISITSVENEEDEEEKGPLPLTPLNEEEEEEEDEEKTKNEEKAKAEEEDKDDGLLPPLPPGYSADDEKTKSVETKPPLVSTKTEATPPATTPPLKRPIKPPPPLNQNQQRINKEREEKLKNQQSQHIEMSTTELNKQKEPSPSAPLPEVKTPPTVTQTKWYQRVTDLFSFKKPIEKKESFGEAPEIKEKKTLTPEPSIPLTPHRESISVAPPAQTVAAPSTQQASEPLATVNSLKAKESFSTGNIHFPIDLEGRTKYSKTTVPNPEIKTMVNNQEYKQFASTEYVYKTGQGAYFADTNHRRGMVALSLPIEDEKGNKKIDEKKAALHLAYMLLRELINNNPTFNFKTDKLEISDIKDENVFAALCCIGQAQKNGNIINVTGEGGKSPPPNLITEDDVDDRYKDIKGDISKNDTALKQKASETTKIKPSDNEEWNKAIQHKLQKMEYTIYNDYAAALRKHDNQSEKIKEMKNPIDADILVLEQYLKQAQRNQTPQSAPIIEKASSMLDLLTTIKDVADNKYTIQQRINKIEQNLNFVKDQHTGFIPDFIHTALIRFERNRQQLLFFDAVQPSKSTKQLMEKVETMKETLSKANLQSQEQTSVRFVPGGRPHV